MAEAAPAPDDHDEVLATRQRIHEDLYAFSESGQRELFFRVLEKHLSVPPTETTYSRLEEALTPLLGTDALFEIGWLTRNTDEINDLPFETPARDFLAEVLALYGPQIAAALYRDPAWEDYGNDWAWLAADVVREAISGDYEYAIRVHKRNGEILRLRSGPDSVLRLARRLISLLKPVEPAALDEDATTSFLEEVSRFKARLDNEASPHQKAPGEA
jgi:hypothetical protein